MHSKPKESPFFSIIIPTFNRGYCIANAIQSVINQTFENWELIIIDDGSTDNTQAVVASFKDNRIRYFWQENKQLNGARNSGVRISKGLYLSFLDDDDLYLENHLEICYNYLQKELLSVGLFHTGMISKFRHQQFYSKGYTEKEFRHPVLYQWKVGMNLLPLIFHKDIFKYYSFDERFLLWDDAHFLIRVLLKYPLFQIANTYTAIYHLSPESRSVRYISKDSVQNSIECIQDVYLKNKEALNHVGISGEMVSEEISKTYISQAHNALTFNRFSLAYYYFYKALSIKPSLKQFDRYLKFFPKSIIIFFKKLLWKQSSKPKF